MNKKINVPVFFEFLESMNGISESAVEEAFMDISTSTDFKKTVIEKATVL